MAILNNIWNVLCNSWIGAVIGFIIGLILCGILSLTMFKAGGLPKIVTTIIILLFALFGGYIQYQFTFESVKAESEEIVLIPGTDIADPDDFLDPSGNDGKEKDEIEESEADPNCPTAEDKNFNISMVEYSDIVIFYYTELKDEQKLLHNIAFEKTETGLIFTGALNVSITEKPFFKWVWAWPFFRTGYEYNFNNLNASKNWFNPLNKEISTNTMNYYFMCYEPTDYAILGNPKKFGGGLLGLFKYGHGNMNCHKLIMNKAQIGCYKIYNNHFQQLGEMGIKTAEETITQDLGTFYNTVYTATKNVGTNSVVDVTSLVGDVKDGVVYKSNRYLSVEYYDYSDKNALAGDKKTPAKEYVEEMQPDTEQTVPATPSEDYIIASFRLSFSFDFDSSDFDITKTPIVIRYVNVDDKNLIYDVVFDSEEDFTMVYVQFKKGKYTEQIISDALTLTNTSGTNTFDGSSGTRHYYISNK